MGKSLLILLAFAAGFGLIGMTLQKLEEDVFPTPAGEMKIFFVGHGSLFLTCGGKVIQIDPWSQAADYAFLPKADIVLITHDHPDHLDPVALKKTRHPNSTVIIRILRVATIPEASHAERRGAGLGRHRDHGAAGL